MWWCSWLKNCATNRRVRFPMVSSFRSYYGPGVHLASNRNEYQEYLLGSKGGRCVGLTTLLSSCADCLEIWEPQAPRTLRTSNIPAQGLLSL